MAGSTEKITEIQRQFLVTMRNVFTTGIGAFVVMQDQGEKLLRMLAEKGAEAQQTQRKITDEWIEKLRNGQEKFKKAVEESFRRAETYFGEAGRGRPGPGRQPELEAVEPEGPSSRGPVEE